ncbi:MAG TPA: ABC transporter permease [Anaerolineales bacterium]|nr:ABC transporter permease [Anaerolineales bacterium]
MQQYIIRRTFLNIFVLILVATMVFGALRIDSDHVVNTKAQGCFQDVTGDVEQCKAIARADLGLDSSIFDQYRRYMTDLAQGDLGNAFSNKEPVRDQIMDRVIPSIELGLLQISIGLAVALPVGIISAIRQDQWIDYILRFFTIFFLGIPVFVVAVFVILITSRWFEGTFVADWMGPHGSGWVNIWEDPIQNAKLVFGAALIGGLASGAIIMRFLRSQMLEVMRQDYVRTAWAKGLRERSVVIRHALKNALIPVLTVIGLLLGAVISGNVILETIYNIEGIGFYVVFSALQFDYPVMQGIVLVVAFFLVFINLLVDIAYGWLDPRIRYS